MPRECRRYSPFIIVEKNAQAGLDSLTIAELSVSRGGPSIERAVCASRCLTDNAITFADDKATAIGRAHGTAGVSQ